MRNSLMDRAAGGQADVIMTHPVHQQALRTLIELIGDLRRCHSPGEQFEFQQRLLGLVLEVEQRHREVRRVVHRLGKRDGKVPRNAPELGTALDPGDVESWKLEEEVYERVWRQYKSIADALAWRALGYDRRIIVALSRGEPAGPMYGKAGLVKERSVVESTWREERKFVLLHDLTSVLRIGDLSVFGSDGTVLLHEVKTNERRRIRAQDQLLYETSAVLADGGALPSGFAPAATGVPFKTDLRGLREVIGLAHERQGIRGGIVSPRRAVVAASAFTSAGRYDGEAFAGRVQFELTRCRRRMGLSQPGLLMTSVDSVARSPVRPPWAIYPLAPHIAAGLITDTMLFFVCISPDAIIDRLLTVGVHAQWMQSPDRAVNWAKPILSVGAVRSGGVRFGTMNPEALTGLLLELVDLDTWCRQVAITVGAENTSASGPDTGDRIYAGVRPWPVFADESETWI